ncbi:MAG: adenylate kinase [Clostridia bacterium]|nr:adenylate kinase [Clostridia bacterium]NCC75428.1 adenylate kinase [Clostridia bacterium]
MRLILLGAPGSGKGTMAADLVREYQIPHISTGDIFRQNIKANTPLGQEANQYIQQGALVPDTLTIAMVADRLEQADCQRGFLLDGFPRTVAQAEALTELLAKRQIALNAVIELELSDESILSRLTGRRVCSSCGRTYNTDSCRPQKEGICDVCGGALYQRDDDKPETIRQRLAHYYHLTLPLSDYYEQKKLLVRINNEGEVGSSLPAVLSALKERS